ncbi:NEDD8-specific protease 2 [Smittium mucronatum]|uniref:NEDD8-specific protease 2 n=1 Tax=Smittium mucronatum TaxID=133383 RepID=A0A1R0GW99_9FUNG|nr:NEDD8-specific protease 2 [Smittium mucronatum]
MRSKTSDGQLFCYHGTTIYDSAAETILDGGWLQDSIVDIECAREALPPEIEEMDYFFMPTNNGDTYNVHGSHWSLLVYEKSKNIFRYYDSLKKSNLEPSRILIERLCILLNKDKTNLVIERSEQQLNDSDCGIYVIIFTEVLIKKLIKSSYPPFQTNPDKIFNKSLLELGTGSFSRFMKSASYDSVSDRSSTSSLNKNHESDEYFWCLEELPYSPHIKRKELMSLIRHFSEKN